jgi:prolyl-tRNA synthetase
MKENIRVHIDKRDINPGNKFYNWELKGVPIRIEIGPKDVEKKQVVMVRRDNGKKSFVSEDAAVETIKKEFDNIAKDLYESAKKLLNENMHRVQTIEDAKDKKGIVELPWCKNEDCALEIENILDGNTLGEPIDDVECKNQSCPICSKPAETWMRYAKSY